MSPPPRQADGGGGGGGHGGETPAAGGAAAQRVSSLSESEVSELESRIPGPWFVSISKCLSAVQGCRIRPMFLFRHWKLATVVSVLPASARSAPWQSGERLGGCGQSSAAPLCGASGFAQRGGGVSSHAVRLPKAGTRPRRRAANNLAARKLSRAIIFSGERSRLARPAAQAEEMLCLQRLQNSRIVTQSVLEARPLARGQ